MEENERQHTALLVGVSAAIIAIAVAALVGAAIFAFRTYGEFIAALGEQTSLSVSFVLSTLAVLFLSSVLMTPVSFGITYRLLQGDSGRWQQVFFLFHNGKLLCKCILMNVLQKIILNLYRIVILIVAVFTECGVFVISVAISGEDVFLYEDHFLESAAAFITRDMFFITLTVIEWCVVLAALSLLRMRYILCKYALLRYPRLSAAGALRIGVFSVRGRMRETLSVYLKSLSATLATVISFGLWRLSLSERFSAYAIRAVETGTAAYYARRSD